MKKPTAFNPSCQTLEPRVVLSLSFSGLVHSIFPFISQGHSAVKKPMTPIQVAQIDATRVHREQARMAARAARLTAAQANSVAASAATQTGTVMYGPYIGRPGSYHQKPPLVVTKHTVK